MGTVPDLGTIEVSRPVGPAQDSTPDILGALGDSLSRGIKKGITDGQIEGANTDFNETADAALSAEPVEQQDQSQEGPPLSRGTPEAIMMGNIRTLSAGVDQAQGSRKAALELELRKQVQDLGNKHPQMRAAYAQELSRFERTDPEMMALGMLDLADDAYSAQSASQLDKIKTRAYGSIASGGLGMDPGKKFGDQAFVREYLFLQGKRSTASNNQLQLETLQSTDALSARDSADNFVQSMTGISNVIEEGLAQARDMTTRVGAALRDPTAPGASVTISEWQNFGKQAVLQDLSRGVFMLEDSFAELDPNQAHTDAYKAAKALKDDRVAALNMMIAGVTADSPTIMKAYEAYETMQLIAYERKFPQFVNDARLIEEMMPMIEVLDDTFGMEGALVRNEIGGMVKQGVENVLGRQLGKTHSDDLPADATPQEIRDHYRQIRADSGNLYDTGQTTGAGQQTQASQDLTLRSRDAYLALAKTDGLSPKMAQSHINAAAADIDQMLLSGPAHPDMLQAIMVDMAKPGYMDMARNSQSIASMQDLGQQVQDAAFKYQPTRNAEFKGALSEEVAPGVSMFEVMYHDETDIKKGNVVFRIDEEKLAIAVEQGFRGATMPTFRTPQLQLANRNALRLANAAAARLSASVSTQLRAEAHGQALVQGLTVPSYTAQWSQGLFNKYFGDLGEDIVARESQGSR